ncbi:MAG: hypothetical protein V8S95_08455 [Odoribacter sp.]
MKHILYILLLAGLITSCTNDDYLIDGGLANPYVNMTTYDYLKSNPLFDTLVMAIDIAGLKDKVNEAGTFYAPTNFSINEYIRDELELRKRLDADAVYTFDSIPVTEFDSIQMYLFAETITRDSLTQKDGSTLPWLVLILNCPKNPRTLTRVTWLLNPNIFFHQKSGKLF